MNNNDTLKERALENDKLVAATRNTKERDYWLDKLSGQLVKSAFPYRSGGIPPGSGHKTATAAIKGECFAALTRLSRGNDHTLHVILTAAVTGLLWKYTGNDDIIVVSPIYKQDNDGPFINTVLILRNSVRGADSFKDLLIRVRQSITQAVEHQDYPIEVLSDRLDMNLFEEGASLIDNVVLLREIHHPRYVENLSGHLHFAFHKTADALCLDVEYPALYEEPTVLRVINHFTTFLETAILQPDNPIAGIEVHSDREKTLMLEDFNLTRVDYPRTKTLHALFQDQVSRRPGEIALTFEAEPGAGRETLTYAQLNNKANRLARLLKEKNVTNDVIVALLLPRSTDMVMAMLAVLKAGGGYMPISASFPTDRVLTMLEDTRAPILLTHAPLLNAVAETHPQIGDRDIIRLDTPADASHHQQAENLPDINSPADLAYVIFTSGSTGKPKGAMLEHRNVVRLLFNDECLYDFNQTDTWTLFHSYCFDISVWEMYGALLYGGKLAVPSEAVVKDPVRYLELLRKEKVTILNQTPSVFYNIMKAELSHPSSELTLRYIIFAGEALAPARLKPWKERYPETRLINMYGITETTVHSTFKEIGPQDIASGISNVGKPIPTLSIYLMAKDGSLVPVGAPGELYVGGDAVCRGYLNRPILTHEKFPPDPFPPGERLYRSGDLARFNHEGELEYLGRIDHQVKIRGFRVELGEIQHCLLQLDQVKDAVVVAGSDESGDNYLCAYIVPGPDAHGTGDSPLTPARVKEHLALTLPDYMVPAYIVEIEAIPLNANGKVDRRRLPAPVIGTDAGGYVPPQSPMQEQLVRCWAEVLGVEAQNIGIDTNFFDIGGHSLRATLLISTIHKMLDVKIPIEDMFKNATVRQLALYIENSEGGDYVPLETVDEQEHYPLSAAQSRFYSHQQTDPESTAFNLPLLLTLKEKPDAHKLKDSLEKLVRRHESFRTSFLLVEGDPVQVIHDDVEVPLQFIEVESRLKKKVEAFIRPFQLDRAPLLRAGVISVPGGPHVFIVDMHHIITDGFANNILIDDLKALFQGRELPPLKYHYRDFVQWEQSAGRRDALEKQKTFWLEQFKEPLPTVELPLDYSRKANRSFAGSCVRAEIDPAVTETLRAWCGREGATIFMLLFAAYNVLLSKICGHEDIVVGTAVAGRSHADLHGIIGLFFNTLALRSAPHREKTFAAFLTETKAKTLAAFENQDFAFDHLVRELAAKGVITRDSNRTPVFDSMFSLNTAPDGAEAPIPGLEMVDDSDYDDLFNSAKLDLLFNTADMGDKILLSMDFSTDLFKTATVEKIVNHYTDIIGQISADPDIPLGDIKLSRDTHDVKLDIKKDEYNDFSF